MEKIIVENIKTRDVMEIPASKFLSAVNAWYSEIHNKEEANLKLNKFWNANV